MATKPVQFISSVEHNIGSFYGTTFCTYGKKPLALLYPQEANSRNGAELSESSPASWVAPTWTEWLHFATLDASHKVLPHRSLLISAAGKYYNLHFASHLLCTCSIQDIVAKAKLCGIGDGKEPTVNASLLHLCALNMKGDEIRS